MAVCTQVIGTRNFHSADRRENGFRTQLLVVSHVAARTTYRPLLGRRNGKLQHLREAGGSDPMHGRTRQHFAGFHVHMPRLTPTDKQGLQPLAYFAGGLLKDRSSRFFSSGVQVLSDSNGRCRQIFSLTEISSALSL